MKSRCLIIILIMLTYFCCLFVLPLFSLANIDPNFVQKVHVNKISENEYFGTSISLSGDTFIVGSSYSSYYSDAKLSGAYVFVHDNNSCWHQQTKLVPSDAVSQSGIGWAVSLSDDTVALGANDAVYIFVRSGSSWSQQAKLVLSGSFCYYRPVISLSGDTLAVSTDEGIQIFIRSGSSWSQQAKFTLSGSCGCSVSLSGDTLAVSANDGVYIFVRSGSSWNQQAKLAGSSVGWWRIVSLSGDTMAFSDYDYIDKYVVYIFIRSGSSWSQQAKLISPMSNDKDNFGHVISLSGDTVLIGSTEGWRNVYVFVRSGSSWSQQAKLASDSPPYYFRLHGLAVSEGTAVIPNAGCCELFEDFIYVYDDKLCTQQKNALPAIIRPLLLKK